MGARVKTNIGGRVRQLLTQKKAMTGEAIAKQVKKEFRGAQTSPDSVAWYASRMRAEGLKPNLKPRAR